MTLLLPERHVPAPHSLSAYHPTFPHTCLDYKDKTMMPGFIVRRHGIFVPGVVRQHHSTLHLLSDQTKDGLVCRGGNGVPSVLYLLFMLCYNI